jgi:hypothetical protein
MFFTRPSHPLQPTVDAAHDEIMRIIQLYASGLCTMPELLVALQQFHHLFPVEGGEMKAIINVIDPATHLCRIA